MSGDAQIVVYAQRHPVNSWVLYAFAVPYFSIDDGERRRLRWGKSNSHVFDHVQAGSHTLVFELRYKGFRRPVARRSEAEAVAVSAGEVVTYRVRNGWTNQHPFVFTRID